ncbi:DUF389 domain-containing protein [Prauserella alba]|uniref:DUF389 domain-containing protein n=1 Tax=Prauserella alba TaxID=176898 RepID=A0ABN1VGR7_9PSEU|nr:DUF389 domain-containing protein [Prauserella alba]MCP2180004.1 putative hydrophobic domain-containing protein [Prauserella alba]
MTRVPRRARWGTGLRSGLAPELTAADIDRMAAKLFLTDRTRRSAFWVLLTLSAIISGTGVVADSTATVIGAMIVAPLMTPILGTAFAAVLSDRRRIVASIAVVLGGAVLVVVIGYALGLLVPGPIEADTNSQVAGRVSPRLIDLVSALATGVVGAFALVRSDVSDTLPGVAIAISLVPPLSVAGLTFESGAASQASGALLLFATNVAAIVATGTAMLAGRRVRAVAQASGWPTGKLGTRTIAVIAGFVVVVSLPLGVGSYHVVRQERTVAIARPAVERWAAERSWQITDLTYERGRIQITAIGRIVAADRQGLRRALDDAGLADVPARLSLVVGRTSDVAVSGR